jgi:hypothetical protein
MEVVGERLKNVKLQFRSHVELRWWYKYLMMMTMATTCVHIISKLSNTVYCVLLKP